MPAVQRSEFTLALNQVAAERGIDANVVIDTVKSAILAAYRKDNPGIEVEEYEVKLNPNNGEAQIYHEGKDITPPGFGRIAAQTAKQVILQKIREAEKTAIISDFSERVGTVVTGTVLRFDGPNVIFDIGKAEGVMPPSEQVSNEHYRQNQRLSIYVVDIREGQRGSEIIVSRSHAGLVKALFAREVPEVSQGSVIIREVAREAGSRSKVAVYSTQSGVDPVGSCVGQKGVRVQAVINELGGMEKIDVVQWSEDPEKLITAALSPAKDASVTVNEETKEAVVVTPDDQLSLAIGKEGQNVRLASKLTGYKIEIKGRTQPEEKEDIAIDKAEKTEQAEIQSEASEESSEATNELPAEEKNEDSAVEAEASQEQAQDEAKPESEQAEA